MAKNATLLGDTETSQVVESKCKEITSKNKKEWQLSKKTKEKQLEKYCGNVVVKMGSVNPYKRYVYAKQDCLVYNSR